MSKAPRKKKGWLNREEMAASCRLTVRGFDGRRVQPIAKIGRETFYDCAAVLEADRETQAARAARQAPPLPTDPADEKLLLIRAQREGQELRNAQTRRELAPIDLISWTLSKVATQISAILDSIPLKVKNIVPRLSAAEIEHIRREIVKAQNAAASVGIDLDEYYGRSPTDRTDGSVRTADTSEA